MDRETRELLMRLTSELSRLSALVEQNMADDNDKEGRIRKLERWMYAIPASFVLTVGTLVTELFRHRG